MNINNGKMSLSENHKLILTVFDEFNSLLRNQFDCYYTGGLMLYISTQHALERYHNDIDLFINENQLLELKKLVNDSKNFKFVSNMNKKDINGHEYKIVYKNIPISIGLFLFERKINGSIVTKKYYYKKVLTSKQLYVDERHFNINYTNLVFDDKFHIYKNKRYKMVSIEYIFYSKKTLKPIREKDIFDLKFIYGKVNMNLVQNIKAEKQKKRDINYKKVNYSIINLIEGANR